MNQETLSLTNFFYDANGVHITASRQEKNIEEILRETEFDQQSVEFCINVDKS